MNKHVLLVEDDENDGFFMVRAFKKTGLPTRLQIATDGQMAIDYLEGTGKFVNRALYPLPSLILTDLKLPQVTGLELLTWIRQRPSLDIPVVILSSSSDEDDIRESYRLGANAYLVKPPETAVLQAMIKSVIEFWLQRHTPSRRIERPATLNPSETA